VFNILSYVLYNLSNLLFVFLIPNNFTKLFFINYSIASGIFTFIIFYHFSKKNLFSEKSLMIIITLLILLAELINSNIYIIWFFTFLIIYSDYFFSQRKNYLVNFALKLLLLISSLLLYQNYLYPIEVLKIKIIITYLAFSIYYLFCKKHRFSALKVNSPLKYNFWTCLTYFGSLFLLTIIVPNSFIKIIYVSFQILIGMQLKLFDLKIRNIEIKYLNTNFIFGLLSFSYLIFLSFYSNLYYIIIFYLGIFLSLDFLKKKYIT
tara:strand:+ start:36345 stop:37133 length:789 start_codon:yes stop_codon:yes gene_type:complete